MKRFFQNLKTLYIERKQLRKDFSLMINKLTCERLMAKEIYKKRHLINTKPDLENFIGYVNMCDKDNKIVAQIKGNDK